VRSHWTLHAQLILFTPLSTSVVGGSASTGTTGTTGTGTTGTTTGANGSYVAGTSW